MKKLITVLTVLSATAIAPSTVTAKSLPAKYKDLRAVVVSKFGQDAAGRHILKHGVRFKWVSDNGHRRHWGSRHAKSSEVARSVRTYRRWLSPPAPRIGAGDHTPTRASAPAHYTGGRFAIPHHIVMCESGGNYRAVNNTAAGAAAGRPAGAYQIVTGTWQANGGGAYAPTADQATPAQQDAVAARIWARSGGAPWECK